MFLALSNIFCFNILYIISDVFPKPLSYEIDLVFNNWHVDLPLKAIY